MDRNLTPKKTANPLTKLSNLLFMPLPLEPRSLRKRRMRIIRLLRSLRSCLTRLSKKKGMKISFYIIILMSHKKARFWPNINMKYTKIFPWLLTLTMWQRMRTIRISTTSQYRRIVHLILRSGTLLILKIKRLESITKVHRVRSRDQDQDRISVTLRKVSCLMVRM